MTDEEVEAALTEVPGIGPWSARGFLLVALDRPDVFLSGDLALRRAIQRAYGLDHLPNEDEVAEISGPLATVSESGCVLPVRVRV
jgi:DNA-3-methyladenine glycosylase II